MDIKEVVKTAILRNSHEWGDEQAEAVLEAINEAGFLVVPAKAQAVPEALKKFCNEHKDPAWRGRLTEYDKGYSDCCIAVLEMIEAQDPAND